jgi:hypothetical protein
MKVAELLMAGKTRREVADELKCSLKTVDAVKSDPDYKQMFYEKYTAQIEQLVPVALVRLRQLLEDDKTQATAQIAAIREVLDRSCLKELLEKVDQEIKVVVSYE